MGFCILQLRRRDVHLHKGQRFYAEADSSRGALQQLGSLKDLKKKKENTNMNEKITPSMNFRVETLSKVVLLQRISKFLFNPYAEMPQEFSVLSSTAH